jgi:hypothetical protein
MCGAAIDVAGHDGHPGGVHAFRDLDRLADLFRGTPRASRRSGLVSEGVFQSIVWATNTPMRMPRRSSAAARSLLLLDAAAAHPVVFERGEPLGRHELELRDEVLAGVLPEHAEVRRVV